MRWIIKPHICLMRIELVVCRSAGALLCKVALARCFSNVLLRWSLLNKIELNQGNVLLLSVVTFHE